MFIIGIFFITHITTLYPNIAACIPIIINIKVLTYSKSNTSHINCTPFVNIISMNGVILSIATLICVTCKTPDRIENIGCIIKFTICKSAVVMIFFYPLIMLIQIFDQILFLYNS